MATLKTETNTKSMERKVRRAASKVLHRKPQRLNPVFEHGQWWITDTVTGEQWSVVDAEGGRSVDGLDFEQVTMVTKD